MKVSALGLGRMGLSFGYGPTGQLQNGLTAFARQVQHEALDRLVLVVQVNVSHGRLPPIG
ncbi:MAG: hypothetical protein J2P46_17505 [Zavarzinella sp.]|nr:hypothetical protein [Zavarzinella sp.]